MNTMGSVATQAGAPAHPKPPIGSSSGFAAVASSERRTAGWVAYAEA